MSSFLHIGNLKVHELPQNSSFRYFFSVQYQYCFFFIIKKFIFYLSSFLPVLYFDLILILSQDILQDSLILALVSLFLFINLSDCVHAREQINVHFISLASLFVSLEPLVTLLRQKEFLSQQRHTYKKNRHYLANLIIEFLYMNIRGCN